MKRLNRRRFLQGAAALAPLLGSALSANSLGAEPEEASATTTLFVGTQTVDGSQGIYAYAWDAHRGTLTPRGLAAATPMPTFLQISPDRRVLFTCNETETFRVGNKEAKSGGVSSFRIEQGARGVRLMPIDSQIAGGPGTTNIALDHTGRALLCANYTGGSASSFQVAPDGRIGPIVSHFQYTGHGPNHERQASPHVHRATVSPGNGFAFFNDLGLDVIHIYRLDAASAKLTPHDPAVWHAPAGSGPRSLRFHPNGRWAYCVTEMGSAVMLLDWDEARGVLSTKQTVSLVPENFKGRSQAAETAITRDGRFLYASDRYYDNFYSFTIDPHTGRAAQHGSHRVYGKKRRATSRLTRPSAGCSPPTRTRTI